MTHFREQSVLNSDLTVLTVTSATAKYIDSRDDQTTHVSTTDVLVKFVPTDLTESLIVVELEKIASAAIISSLADGPGVRIVDMFAFD